MVPYTPDDIRHETVDVGDGTLHVAIAGDGPPLIMLHGWTLDWRMWLPQVAALAKHFRLIMPDRRGFGRSTAPPNLRQEAHDVQRIADNFGLKEFALLGLSQGAAIALHYAHRNSSRLLCVIASGAPLPCLVSRDEVIEIERFEQWAKRSDMATMRSHWLQHPLMRHDNPETQQLVEDIVADYEGRDLLARSELPAISSAKLSHLPTPLLAMTGQDDSEWRRACAKALARTVPRGSHCEIALAGHLANVENPDDFTRIVRDFIAEHTG